MKGELQDRTALVTGAGSGLGRAIARSAAAAGARVILVGRNAGKLRSVSAGLPGSRVACCDVSDPADVSALAAELADETVSLLVNNAGTGGPVAPLHAIEAAEWDEVFTSNVRSVFLMCKAFLPPMLERGSGDIINIASVTGKRPLIRRTPYAASKMAVLGLTRTLAFEAGPRGVSVNSLSPGPVRGDRMRRNFALEAQASGRTEEEAEHEFVSRSALGRLVEEEEVGRAVVAMTQMAGLCGADIDLSAGMIAP